METVDYVSSLCRIGDHAGCDEHPVVKCDCDCHKLIDLNRLGEQNDPEEQAPDPTVDMAH